MNFSWFIIHCRFAKKILETKSHLWREEIAYLVLKVCLAGLLLLLKTILQCTELGKRPKIELPVSSEEFVVRRAAPRPIKAEAVRHHQTRMKMSWNAACLARHNTYLAKVTGQKDISYQSTVYDIKILISKFAQERSFSIESVGGGSQSNCCPTWPTRPCM